MRKLTIPAAVFAFLVAIAVGCGGDDDDGGGGGSGAERAIETDAQERAEGVVLQLSDFPDGWRASAPEDEDEEQRAVFRECVGIDYSDVTIIGDAESDDFAMGSAEAASDAVVYETETEATTAWEELTAGYQSESANDCLKEFIEGSVEPGVEIGDVELGELSFTPPTGVDEARAYQLVIPVESTSGADEGTSATVYLDYLDVREGDLLARVVTSDVLSEFDPELRDQLVEAVTGRAAE